MNIPNSSTGLTTWLLRGALLAFLLVLLLGCAGTMATRTKNVPIKWPQRLSAACKSPSPPESRFSQETRHLPQEINEWKTALKDCNSQLEEGRVYEDQVAKDLEKSNEKK